MIAFRTRIELAIALGQMARLLIGIWNYDDELNTSLDPRDRARRLPRLVPVRQHRRLHALRDLQRREEHGPAATAAQAQSKRHLSRNPHHRPGRAVHVPAGLHRA